MRVTELSLGVTINTGNFSSIRADLKLERGDESEQEFLDKAKERLQQEISKLKEIQLQQRTGQL